MTDLTPFDTRREHALGAPQVNAPHGRYAGRTTGHQDLADDHDGIPWSRYFSAVKRGWWIIVLVLLTGTATGIMLARMQPVMYVAESRLLINPGAAQQNIPLGTRPVIRNNSLIQLLRSYAVVDPIVRDLRLNISFGEAGDLRRGFYLDSTFRAGEYRLTVDSVGQRYTLSDLASAESMTGTAGDSIGRPWGFQWAPSASLLPPGRTVDFRVREIREASKGLLSRLSASMPGEDGQFMVLTFSDRSPHVAADILNTWVDRFIAAASEFKRSSLVESRQVVDAQLAIARGDLAGAENAFQRFSENTAGLPGPGGDGGATGSVLQQRLELEDLERDRLKLERLLAAAVGGAIPPEEFYSVPNVLNTTPRLVAALEELESVQASKRARPYLTEAHPEIDSLNREIQRLEITTIPRITRDVVAAYRLREQEMRVRVDATTQQLRDIPSRTVQQARLQRDVAQREGLHNMLSRRSQELRITDAETTPDLARLDIAEPPRDPQRNEAARLLLMAVVASLGAGIGIAILRDRLDRRFRYPEQATMDLGLTIAGTVPRLRFNRKNELGITALSQVVESFRALRLTVRHHFPADAPVVLCVSSPGAEEGKSLVSSNLAVAFANAGSSTLLIDGDVRRGVVHSTFDVPRRPGLIDHLNGQASGDDVIRATNTPNLSVIASGIRSKNAPELLVSDAMPELVASMRERFDVVIIDSAPFSAGMDAFALGAAAGTMLVVLRPGVTDRKLAAMKLEVLDRLPVGVVGAVLNGIAHGSEYRYYYSDYGYTDAREWALDDDATDPSAALTGNTGTPRLGVGKKS